MNLITIIHILSDSSKKKILKIKIIFPVLRVTDVRNSFFDFIDEVGDFVVFKKLIHFFECFKIGNFIGEFIHKIFHFLFKSFFKFN